MADYASLIRVFRRKKIATLRAMGAGYNRPALIIKIALRRVVPRECFHPLCRDAADDAGERPVQCDHRILQMREADIDLVGSHMAAVPERGRIRINSRDLLQTRSDPGRHILSVTLLYKFCEAVR